MRQLLIAVAATLLGMGSAFAEGYQVNTLSTKQIGMGHAGIAMELGAESMFFNPGAMAYMDKTLDLSGSFTAIMPKSTATLPSTGVKYATDCDPSTPIYINAAFSIYDNLKAGVSFYTPYGSSINWTENWPGAVLSQDVNLKVFTIQPTVSWAITPRLSVGAGAMISWGTVNLNKGLVSAETFDKALPLLQQLDPRLNAVEPLGTTTPASVNLNGKSDVTVGLNVGALYKINERVNVGASFRTRMAMKVDAGVASVKYANRGVEAALGETLNLIDQANFRAQMPCPWVLGLGVSWKPVDRLTLALDGRLTGWHTYKQLNVEFLAEQLRDYDQHIPKHYSNSWCFSAGGQYAVTGRFDARLGLMVDTTPVDRNFYNPETPGMTKIEPTVGLSFRPISNLSIDVAFMYVHGCGGKDTSCSYPDLMGKAVIGNLTKAYTLGAMSQGMPADQALLFGQNQAMQTAGAMGISSEGTFSAKYTVRALIPSIGISYSF